MKTGAIPPRTRLHDARTRLHNPRTRLQLTILNTIYITILKRARGDEFLLGSDVLCGFWLGWEYSSPSPIPNHLIITTLPSRHAPRI